MCPRRKVINGKPDSEAFFDRLVSLEPQSSWTMPRPVRIVPVLARTLEPFLTFPAQ